MLNLVTSFIQPINVSSQPQQYSSAPPDVSYSSLFKIKIAFIIVR